MTLRTSSIAAWTCSDSSRTVSFSFATSISARSCLLPPGTARTNRRTRRPARRRSDFGLSQVPDLALEEGPLALELRHVPAAQGCDRRVRRRRQLRLAEGLEAPPGPAASSRRCCRGCRHRSRSAWRAAGLRGRWPSWTDDRSAARRGLSRQARLYWDVHVVTLEGSSQTCRSKSQYKVVILGSGPAGLTAALYASRAELEPLVVEGGGGDDPTDVPGRPAHADHRRRQLPRASRGDPGPGADGEDARAGRALRDGVRAGRASSTVDLAARPFVLDAGREGEITAETLIVATGARAKWLGLPEELEFRTQIGGVSACATCDGFFYKGKDVLVVGGGDTAMEEATFLTKFANQVTVVHRRDELRASKIMQTRAPQQPEDRLAARQRDREDPGRPRPGRDRGPRAGTSRRAR